MPVIYHPEMTRSFRDLGKVKLYQSFNSYYPPAPNRRNLGTLVALDNIHYLPGDSETCTFPHQNTEVLTLVLHGTIISKDNTGCTYTLTRDIALLLSAGTGIEIANSNGSLTEEADLLQMRFIPGIQNGLPYHQVMESKEESRFQQLKLLVSPDNENDSLKIKQQVWIRRGTFTSGSRYSYHKTNEANDVYLFVLQGHATVEGKMLKYRDGLAVSETGSIVILFDQLTDLLFIESPHQIAAS